MADDLDAITAPPPERQAILRCLCSQCAGRTLFPDPYDYLDHTRTGLRRPSTQLSMFPALVPDVPWP
jgi:hypothetical protein